MTITLHKPGKAIHGKVHLPGSKSISNRLLMIQALGALNFKTINLSDSDDTRYLSEALEVIRNGSSKNIDIAHAGTDMRFLTAYLSLQQGSYELTGSERMQKRPVKELVEVLKELGADIKYKHTDGFPPLLISGKKLRGGKASIKGNVSSQFISALLLVAPYFESGLELTIEGRIVSRPYIDMTVALMREFGAKVLWQGEKIVVMPGTYHYGEAAYRVESDWSAASYYYSVVALSPPGTTLALQSLFKESLQADAACRNIFNLLGVETIFQNEEAFLHKKSGISVSTLQHDFINCPDIAQTLVCTCTALGLPFYFSGLSTLKVKETDRSLALKNELDKLGCQIHITEDTVTYDGNSMPIHAETALISTYHDHRMAMSFAPLVLVRAHVMIQDAEVVSKSYPLFWDDLKSIGIPINPEPFEV